MLIYFDESYDTEHRYLLLGALFNPHPKYLHRELLDVKRKYNCLDRNGKALEIKYFNCTSKRNQEMNCKAIDIFMRSTSYFRAIVIDQKLINLDRFGKKGEPDKIKMARAYKKFSELLLSHNTENIYNGVLLTDELTRCNGDKFIEIMKQDFCTVGGKHCNDNSRPTLKDIRDIKSHIEDYQVNQINDILLGSILNNIYPTKKEYKNNVRNYLIKCLGVKNLLPETWNIYSKNYVEKYYPKYNIWYWKPID
ncbi:hypothetical protein A2531_03130 [Candidatus Falkowbacteria bacterium RIFOXYD2_FULL_34_120]|uniref:DUF3800 domain-containing protein n=1 Tax=Candidatus Falkowbacteria bacterium RIFOXYD2_FULL_34_120 TaxID=1798007 RepID=A0A1F5TR34_9BACT|nr:MAG: hypothetical protein A2466_02235 [Candidatus Falkowbacteria bacterium RIFOXYC2_FULL_34_220]OGF39034.1 MAG: hypothetical protein A2515_03000 [Candidatus Falkowbacteria bacterium RIFOXYD12_FULL_34_57]OGF40991.1 MAG: hypothetical protein A2531_03130 [Candidatus Falkowbacteria bacterium RIFOXYD2_FULL_34_120]